MTRGGNRSKVGVTWRSWRFEPKTAQQLKVTVLRRVVMYFESTMTIIFFEL